MRRLRFVAALQAASTWSSARPPRRAARSLFERAAADPSLRAHAFAVMAGPEALPPEMFTDAHRARVLGA